MSEPTSAQQPDSTAPDSTAPDSTSSNEDHTNQDAHVVVVTQDGIGVSSRPRDDDGERNPAELVEQPAKVMRIGGMIKQLLEEVRSAPLDQAGRERLAEIHERSLHELEQGLAPELVDELRRISLPFNEGQTPSDAELRIAQAQLVGWLEGLFHGIQTALMAQQMAARAQLEQMRRALPPGGLVPGMPPGAGVPQPGRPPGEEPRGGTGQYL